MQKARSYPESTQVLWLDRFEFLVDDRLKTDGFPVQVPEFAETLHPLGLLRAMAILPRKLVPQCLGDEFFK
jgi:hypothetical protein